MLQVFSIFLLLTSILSFLLGLLVLFKRTKKNTMTLAFLGLAFFTSLWAFSYYLSVSINDYDIAVFWAKMVTFNSIWIPIFLFNWVHLFLKDIGLKKVRFNYYITYFSYFLGFFFSFFSFSKLMISSFEQKLYFLVWPNPGILYHFYFILCYVGLSFYTGIILLKYYKIAKGYARNQIKYVSIGCIVALIGGISNFFLWYNILMPPYGNFFIPIYPIAFTYAMIKYRLMDIRLVISKSILYFALIGLVALAFTSITFITGELFTGQGISKIIVTLVISLIIVLGLDPLKRLLAKLTDKVFFKDKVDYQEVLKNLGFIIAREIELKKLFIDLSGGLEKYIKCKNVTLLYKNKTTGMYRGFESENIFFTKNDEIIKYLEDTGGIIITEELDRLAREQKSEDSRKKLLLIVERLDKMKIGLIAPIMSNGDITAILIIDKKLSGDTFSGDDIGLISVLMPQIATALEKARLYNEIQAFNINLQAKIEQATKELKRVNVDLETRNKYLTSLQKISGTITRTLDLSKAVQFLASSIRSEIGFIGGVINFIDENKNAIYIGAMSSDEMIQKSVGVLKNHPTKYFVSLDDGDNLAVKSIITGKIQKTNMLYDVFIPAITRQESEYIQKALSISSIVSVPIYSENKIIGSIDYFLGINLENIKSADLEVMKSLADQTGLVIANIKLYGQLSAKNLELEQANVHLQKLDQAKSEFLSIASHQLRTPLTGIKGYLSMMLEGDFGKFTSKQNDIIGDVFEASNRMTKLVNVFLNVSRIESGRLKLELQEVDLKEVIEKSVKDLESSAEKKGIELSFKDARKKEYKNKIKIDPDKIKDVILNLVDNSIKYTNKGHVKIEVDSDNENSTIKIQDTGIGLDKDDMQKLFSKFSRGDDSAKINTDGSGLGLYIARKMVEIHSGKIWVESDGKDKGSTFYITIPNNLS